MFRLFLPLLATLCLVLPVPAAANWTAGIAPQAPDFFYIADKSRKLLFELKGGEKVSISRQFDCIHGRVEGDKFKEGDLRTPEGVYFITRKITQKLDFMEYGPHAFALNYPNPVDRVRKKTGSGIWLHSKGQPIAGLQTRGCLAVEQNVICDLVPLLKPGTPVIIAERVSGTPFFLPPEPKTAPTDTAALPAPASEKKADAKENSFLQWLIGKDPAPAGTKADEKQAALAERKEAPTDAVQSALTEASKTIAPSEGSASGSSEAPAFKTCDLTATQAGIVSRQTAAWLKLWKEGSSDILALYSSERYPTGSREKLPQLKKRIQAEFKDKKRAVEEKSVRLMAGPGYWVSCFTVSLRQKKGLRHEQRALYWMPDSKGGYTIVGEVRLAY